MSAVSISTDSNWLEESARVIDRGGVVALAYEALFGLAADAFNPDAVARSAAIKDRPELESGSKPISVILPSTEHLKKVAKDVPPLALDLSRRH